MTLSNDNRKFAADRYESPSDKFGKYVWLRQEQLENDTDPEERAAAYKILRASLLCELAQQRIDVLEPQTDWHLKRWMFYGLMGFGVFLNLGLAFTLTIVMPRWMQVIVVAPISSAISYIVETAVGLTLAKLSINANLQHRVKRFEEADWLNAISRDLARSLTEFQWDREYQDISLFDYLPFFLPLGEVLAIAYAMVILQPESGHWLGQFISTVVLVSPIGFLPIMIAVIFSHFEYQPMLRWRILRSYKRFIGKDDGGPLRHAVYREPTSSSNDGKAAGNGKDNGAERRRIHLP